MCEFLIELIEFDTKLNLEYRANLNLQIGLLTEHEMTRVLQMLDAIQDKMGIENDEDRELADLEMETKPEDVLIEISRLQELALKRKKLRKRNKTSLPYYVEARTSYLSAFIQKIYNFSSRPAVENWLANRQRTGFYFEISEHLHFGYADQRDGRGTQH